MTANPKRTNKIVVLVNKIRNNFKNRKEFEEKAVRKSGKSYVKGTQVRFIDMDHYVIEIICDSPYIEPIKQKEASLLKGIKKSSGAGITFPHTNEGQTANAQVIMDGLFGRQRIIGVKDNTIINSRLIDGQVIDIDGAPVTSCGGASGSCCEGGVQVGKGILYTTSDCPNRCFQICSSAPTTISFNSNPVADVETREVVVFGKRVDMEFGFKINDIDGYLLSATINYGDGQFDKVEGMAQVGNESEVNHELTHRTMHTYICREASCEFVVKITAEDIDGQALAETRLNKITVYQVTQ